MSAIRTVVIHPGERIILPQDAVIQSLVIDGDISVTSTCNNLPDPSAYKCGFFFIKVDSDNNDGHSMDELYTYILNLKVASNTYEINRRIITSGDNPGVLQTAAVLNTHVPDQAIFSFKTIGRDTLSVSQNIYIYFQTISSLFNSIELKVDNRGSIQYYRPTEAVCGVYEFGDIPL